MKGMWEWRTLGLGWSVLWRSTVWGGPPLVVLVAVFWPSSFEPTPFNLVSNGLWIPWVVMAEGIAVRLAMKKWSGRLTY